MKRLKVRMLTQALPRPGVRSGLSWRWKGKRPGGDGGGQASSVTFWGLVGGFAPSLLCPDGKSPEKESDWVDALPGLLPTIQAQSGQCRLWVRRVTLGYLTTSPKSPNGNLDTASSLLYPTGSRERGHSVPAWPVATWARVHLSLHLHG